MAGSGPSKLADGKRAPGCLSGPSPSRCMPDRLRASRTGSSGVEPTRHGGWVCCGGGAAAWGGWGLQGRAVPSGSAMGCCGRGDAACGCAQWRYRGGGGKKRVVRNSRADCARAVTERGSRPGAARSRRGARRGWAEATGSSFYDAGDTMMRGTMPGTCAAGVHAEGGLSGVKPECSLVKTQADTEKVPGRALDRLLLLDVQGQWPGRPACEPE